MFSNQTSPRTIQAMGDYAKQVKMVLKASVLIFAICSSIAFSIHPIPARSSKTNAAGGGYAPAVSGASGTTIFVSPALLANASLTVGMNVTVSVFINNVTKLDAWEFKIKADTSILKAVDADATPFWDTQQAQAKARTSSRSTRHWAQTLSTGYHTASPTA